MCVLSGRYPRSANKFTARTRDAPTKASMTIMVNCILASTLSTNRLMNPANLTGMKSAVIDTKERIRTACTINIKIRSVIKHSSRQQYPNSSQRGRGWKLILPLQSRMIFQAQHPWVRSLVPATLLEDNQRNWSRNSIRADLFGALSDICQG